MTPRLPTSAPGLACAVLLVVAAACTSDSATSDTTAVGLETDAAQAQTTTSTPATDADTERIDSELVCWVADPAGGGAPLILTDVTAEAGLIEPLTGVYGHAAAWGDLDGDLIPDLVLGTFADKPIERYRERGADGPKPDMLLIGGAPYSPRQLDGAFGRTSGAAMVDLDGDGDLDVVLSRNVAAKERGDLGSEIYRNDAGALTPVGAGIDPELSGRSVGVLDYDHDGLADLFILEDHYAGGNARLFRNLGDLQFADVTAEAGLPDGIHGLGVATADIDRDGHTDFFAAGSNRLFLGTGAGFTEATLPVFEWEAFGNEDDVAGAAFADVDLDGRLDLVVGHHYNSTVSRDTQVPIRLYLNRTETPGEPRFDDVTEDAGLVPIPTKAPHVEFADLDNDGNLDIVTSASAADGSIPAVFRGIGVVGGIPRFEAPTGLGSDQYWTTAPTVDVDRDGRLDIFAVEWFPTLPSRLFVNESASGNWISVSIDPDLGPGVGTAVEVYTPGGIGDPAGLLGYREITATQGYTAGSELLAHFGLGSIDMVDISITMPGSDPVTITSVAANAHIRYPNGCG